MEERSFRTYWLPKARRLHDKLKDKFPEYNEQSNREEVIDAVQQVENNMRVSHHIKEKRRRYTFWAGIVELFFRFTPFGFDFTHFKKDLDQAIVEEEHYLEDDFYKLSPAERLPSPGKEIALIIVLQLLQRFLSHKQSQPQSRPYSGSGTLPQATNQPIHRTGGNGPEPSASNNENSLLANAAKALGIGNNQMVKAGLSLFQNFFPGNSGGNTFSAPPSSTFGQPMLSQPLMPPTVPIPSMRNAPDACKQACNRACSQACSLA